MTVPLELIIAAPPLSHLTCVSFIVSNASVVICSTCVGIAWPLLFITTFIFCMIYYYIFVMGTVSFYEFAYLLSHDMGAGGSMTVVLDTIIPCLIPFIVVGTILFLLNKYLFKSNK